MEIDPRELEYRDAYRLFTSTIVPRPIAFVATIGENGIYNLAPISVFSSMGVKPPLVHINIGRKRDGRKKDTLVNIEFTKDFVINVVNESLAEAMNQSSAEYPSDVDEFQEVGLTPVKADLVKSPLVAESPINMECRLVQILEFGESPRLTSVVIGEVVRVHIKDELYVNGGIRMSELKALGRLGGDLYCRTTDIITMKRPD
ncbi:MAG: flavin reductase family protein [Chloroflexota bacterium]